MLIEVRLLYYDTHAACGTLNHFESGLYGEAVEIHHFVLSDLASLFLGDRCYFGTVRLVATALHLSSLEKLDI